MGEAGERGRDYFGEKNTPEGRVFRERSGKRVILRPFATTQKRKDC